MFDQECVPYAPLLIESMRSLGYSFSSAIADLIDNSISAKAKNIDIIALPSSSPEMIILDDGVGMSAERLYEAMRYGSSNPLEERDKDDLGRFGLGMKSASLSQCRRLIVASKQGDTINAFSWDLDYVIKKGKWTLKGYSEKEINNFPFIDLLLLKKTGTYIFLSEFDRIKETSANMADTFNIYLRDMSDHLSLVFHRFLEDGLIIRVNERILESRDPFLLSHPATQKKKDIPLYINEQKIVLKPFILPHSSKLSQSDLDKLGGKERLRNDQGFYIYRNKRLIIWGTWFRLERKDELNKLARVRVDIPNTLDYMWAIDIKKSSATLPDIIKKNMFAAVLESVKSSERTQTYTKTIRDSKDTADYIWERKKTHDGIEYVINRDIPQLKMLVATLDRGQERLLKTVLRSLEESFPVSSLYVDVAKGQIEDRPPAEIEEIPERIWDDLMMQIKYVIDNNLPLQEYCEALIKVEPYCKYLGVVNKVKEEYLKDE